MTQRKSDMPTLYMLVGVPGSGKTTWINNREEISINDHIVGTDYIVQEIADHFGINYNEAFPHVIKFAEHMMNKELEVAIKNGGDIYWDQTNTTRKSRDEKLSRIPIHYHKVAVYFATPADLEERLASRPGKTIPEHVIDSMVSNLEMPTIAEGFDDIIHV